jgi:hypothetical protein
VLVDDIRTRLDEIGAERRLWRPGLSRMARHSVRTAALPAVDVGLATERRVWSGPDPDDERSVRRRLSVLCVGGSWYLHGVRGQKFFGCEGLTWQLISPG